MDPLDVVRYYALIASGFGVGLWLGVNNPPPVPLEWWGYALLGLWFSISCAVGAGFCLLAKRSARHIREAITGR